MFEFFKKKVSDPVCKMNLDNNKTNFSSEYQGRKYYFCSQNCLNKFNEGPEKYLVPQENVSKQEGCC